MLITPRAPQLHVVSPSPDPSSLPTEDYQRDFAVNLCGQIKEYRRNRHIGGAPNSELRFLCASATQAGKTRAMIKFCKEYKRDHVKPGEKLKIIFLAFSGKDVRQATIKDFAKAGLKLEVWTIGDSDRAPVQSYIHPGNALEDPTTMILNEVRDFRANGGHIIWINDEADHSSGGVRVKGSVEYQSQLRQWVRQHEVPLWDVHPPSDRKSHEVGIHVTATMAHMVDLVKDITIIPEMRFTSFKLDYGYSGLDTLNDLGVFEDNAKYLGRANLPALIDLCKEWIEKDQKAEDYCYHILRSQDKKTIDALKTMWKSRGGIVEHYDCDRKSFDIKELSQRLDSKPAVPTLILLKQGFSRGSRIHTVDHIANCFDSKRNNEAAVIQSLPGRMTGRRSGPEPVEERDENRPLRSDSYHKRLKIYCDLDAIQKEIPAIEAQRPDSPTTHEAYIQQTYPGQSGTWSKKTTQRARTYSNPVATVFNTQAGLDAAVAALGQLIGADGNSVPHLSMNTVSVNSKNDLAGEALVSPARYKCAASASNPLKVYAKFHADGPNPCFVNSWNAFPHQGKWILVEVDVTLGKKGPVYVSEHGC